jgi:hypothetical protein
MKKKIVGNPLYLVPVLLVLIFYQCKAPEKSLALSPEEKALFKSTAVDTVAITSEETEYEIIIIEPGFFVWLQSIALPEGYYSQEFLENRNRFWVTEWNNRVLLPYAFDPNLYLMQIDYDFNIDYGYEVNYKLYNYFVYFQRRYNQRLGTFVPRL